eukprot:1186078-Prorocentrum_minimum.AAC.4
MRNAQPCDRSRTAVGTVYGVPNYRYMASGRHYSGAAPVSFNRTSHDPSTYRVAPLKPLLEFVNTTLIIPLPLLAPEDPTPVHSSWHAPLVEPAERVKLEMRERRFVPASEPP